MSNFNRRTTGIGMHNRGIKTTLVRQDHQDSTGTSIGMHNLNRTTGIGMSNFNRRATGTGMHNRGIKTTLVHSHRSRLYRLSADFSGRS
jgi:hypothetical protein